jgi:NADH-quinone oxidoreductase subunit C
MDESPTLKAIKEHLGDEILNTHSQFGQDTVVVSETALLKLGEYLKGDLGFEVLMDVTAVDHWKSRPRFEVVYHFLSLKKVERLRVKVPVDEPDPEVSSLVDLWPSADWYEREVFDMFGVNFRGHPNLKRILMYPEFEGHPLRKDYPITKRQPIIGPKD